MNIENIKKIESETTEYINIAQMWTAQNIPVYWGNTGSYISIVGV